MHAHYLINAASKTMIHSLQLTKKLWFLCFVAASFTLYSVAYAEEAVLVIEKIRCEGNERSTCDFILQQTSLREGDRAQDEKLKEAVLKLRLAGHYSDADIRLEKGSAPGKAEAVIRVNEKSSYGYSVSAGVLQPQEKVNAVADITGVDRNFTGRGDSLSIRVRGEFYDSDKWAGVDHQALRLEYIRPGFLTPRMYLIAGLAGMRFHNRERNRDPRFVYKTYDYWADLALGYKLFDYSFITLGFRSFPELKQTNAFFQAGWDSQDNPYFPTQGSRLLAEFTRVQSPYSSSYTSFNGSFLKHWRLGEGHVLSLRLGSLNGIDPYFRAREEEATSLRYTRILKKSDGETIRKKAFYAEGGRFYGGYAGSFYGAKLGTTLQTDAGVINLFIMGGKD